jgi:tetratricopeptide (TPR) repeat protein
MKLLRTIVLGLVCLIGAAAPGLAEEKAKRLPVTEATTRQKAVFIGNLVSKSATSRLIEQSDDATAKATLAESRALLEKANADLAAGHLEQADNKLNRIQRDMSAAARRLSEKEVKGERQHLAYETRKESVQALMEAYDRVAKEKNVGQAALKNRDLVNSYVKEAEALARGGNWADARAMMDKAYGLATKITKDLREGDTLVKELKFETPKDEYLYEVDRNDSHVYLLDLTIKDKKPNPATLSEIETLRKEAEEFRRMAERQAEKGDYAAAISSLGESTKRLVKAIRMGGNFIPG